MMRELLDANREYLIDRCRTLGADGRSRRSPSPGTEHFLREFLGQVIEALAPAGSADASENHVASTFSGPTGKSLQSRIAASAVNHGEELLQHGFTLEQVIHAYGGLSRSMAELVTASDARIRGAELEILNRCFACAIAGAAAGYERCRDQMIASANQRAMGERLGFLAHELRNFLNTAVLAFAAVKSGSVGIDGSTSRVIDRSLVGLRDLIEHALADVRLAAAVPSQHDFVVMERFIAEFQVAASLEAKAKGCEFTVHPVEPGLAVYADWQMLHSAISNLVHNALKFTRPHSHVGIKAYGTGERVLIEIEDQCGGLPAGKADAIFLPFQQHHADRSGLGLGLSISRRAVEACGGELRVRDVPGTGCVFIIDLPRQDARRQDAAPGAETAPSHPQGGVPKDRIAGAA